jgi:hypothetical protein
LIPEATAVGTNPYGGPDLAAHHSDLDFACGGRSTRFLKAPGFGAIGVDILWTDRHHRRTFDAAGLRRLEVRWPLARDDDPGPRISEQATQPWVIYVRSAS